MRVLWCGDSPRASTGFARCTRAACDALHRRGWHVDILGINDFGDPGDYHSPIWPCRQPLDGGSDSFGVTRLPHLIVRQKPDVAVILNDPWNMGPYLEYIERYAKSLERNERKDDAALLRRTPIVAWLAVDGDNVSAKNLNQLARVMVWTDYAAKQLAIGGYEGGSDVVPLGVDSGLFSPRPIDEARTKILPEQVPPNAFVVGSVGRNQLRKRLDLTLQYFGEWIASRGIDDAYLYMHVAPTGDTGIDIPRVAKYYGLAGKLIVMNQGVIHDIGDDVMPLVYSALDLYWTTTQGEGWGLPALEAMACGVPVLAPDWSGLGDWAQGAAKLIECTGRAPTAPLNELTYTIGGVPDRELTLEALDYFYAPETRNVRRLDYAKRGAERAEKFNWQATGNGVAAVLERLMDSVRMGVA